MNKIQLLNCSLDELLTERQKAIEAGNLTRYFECDKLITVMHILSKRKTASSK